MSNVRLLACVFYILWYSILCAQPSEYITAYQYFYNTDPGNGVAGNGAVVAVSPTTDLNQSIPISLPGSLSDGIHQLYFRVKDEFGRWSIAERRSFYITDVIGPASNITGYQFYFDTEPGVGVPGNGAVVAVSPTTNFNQNVAISLPGSLSKGIHQLYIRTKDENGRWSLAERRSFYITDVIGPATNTTAYQYYYDTDPGVGQAGNGAIVTIPPTTEFNQTIAIPLPGSLSQGIHQLYIRARDEDGRWSLAERRTFYITSVVVAAADINAYQFYIDTDPGVEIPGNGAIVSVPVTATFNQQIAITIPGSLSTGIHQLYIRARDVNGHWSISERRMFYVNEVVEQGSDIASLEYFIDTDPGVGNANEYPVAQTSEYDNIVTLAVPCLSTGTHYLYIRAIDTEGRWSIIERDTFSVTSGVEPSVVSPSGPISICNGNSIVLSTTPVPGVSYQWVESGVPIPGATNPSLTVTSSGSYALRTICGSFVLSNTVVVSVTPVNTYYADTDNDGYGNSASTFLDCTQPAGYVTNDDDCDDSNATIHPNAVEICNLVDEDCDGTVDEGVQTLFYADADNDGFGDPVITVAACSSPAGYVPNDDDCDDANSMINPGATEICNATDDDCDGQVDEGVQTLFYADADDDGFGDPGASILACSAPAGYISDQSDCNDASPDIHPGAVEMCNNLDDDCDNEIDEGFVPSVAATAIASSNGADFCAGGNTELNVIGGLLGTGAVWKWYEGSCGTSTSIGSGSSLIISPDAGVHIYFVRAEGTCNSTTCVSISITVYAAPSQELCPASFSINNDASLCSTSPSYSVSFSGNPAPSLSYELTGATAGSGTGTGTNSTFNVGQTNIEITASNLCGSALCEFAITVDDNEGPVFNDCAGTISADVEAGQWGAHVEWDEPLVNDNCEVDGVSSSHQPGDFFVVGTTAVTYTATDIHGNSSTCSFNVVIDPPEVLGDINISVFANDIQFSDPTPEPGSNISVYVTVHNYSNVNAGSFVCRLFDAYSEEYYPDIIVSGLDANQSTTISWNILTPEDPAFVPIKVTIDENGSLAESNELDNEAQRPYVNGEPEIGGRIMVLSSPVPQTSVSGTIISICGSAYYVDTSVPLEDSSVAGAQVTINVVETGQVLTGTTNSNGDFCIPYQTPYTAGLYHYTAEVTDFTLTGDTTNTFALTEPVNNCPKDLTLTLQLSGEFLCGQVYHIAQGQSLTGAVSVFNGCDTISQPTTLFISLPDGSPVPGPFTIPALLPGARYDVALPAMYFNTPGITYINATVDYYNVVSESNETNNSRNISIHVHPGTPDIYPVNGGVTTSMECIPGYVSFVIRNLGGSPTGDFLATMDAYFESTLDETQTQLVTSIPGLCERVITFPFDADSEGSFSFQLDCDLPNDVVELSETNNSFTVSKIIAACDRDLMIDGNCGAISVTPANPAHPGMITIHATIVNSGELAVTTPFEVNFDVAGTIYSVAVSATIPSGGTYAISATVPTPAHGNNLLMIYVDTGNDVPESDEGNNSVTENLCWDFSLTNITCIGSSYMSAAQRICEPANLRIGLRNQGLYAANSLQTKFEISGPGLPPGWLDLGTVTTFIGHTCACPVEIALPNPFLFPQTGGYNIRITADPANQYTECAEGNNEFLFTMQVQESPDYTVYSQYIAPSDINPDLNESISFNLTYKNEGCSGEDPMELMLMVDNAKIDSVIAEGLISGTFGSYAMSETWSSNLPGVHVVRSIIDHDNVVSEVNELNNEATRAIVVGDVPDFNITSLQVSDDTPQPGQTITIDVTVLNEGRSNGDGTLQVFMVTALNQEVLIHESLIHLATLASVFKSYSYFISEPVTQVIARVINVDPAEFDFSDNERRLDLNGLIVDVISTDVSCAGLDLGSLEVQVSGGQAPYFVQWSNGYSGNQIAVASGTYSVTVSDANGETITRNDTIMDLALPVTWYADTDGDGYGNPDVTDYTCTPSPGYVGTGTDCNDAVASTYPDAPEIPDGMDNDCDGLSDEGLNTLDVDAGDCNLVLYGYEPTECQTLSVNVSGGVIPYTYLWSNGATTPTTEVCPEETTIYSVVVTDHNGFTAEDNVTVQVIDISCGNNNNKVLVCHIPPGNPENVQVICIAPSAIQAHLDHGCYVGICDASDPCEGANQSLLIGTNNDDETTDHLPEPAANIHADEKGLFLIEPNPADQQVEIKSAFSEGSVYIMDVSGKIVSYKKLSRDNNIFNTASLTEGIYFIRMESENYCEVKSLIIIHY